MLTHTLSLIRVLVENPDCLFHYRGRINYTANARSKLTSQGQISVPVEVRRKLGIGPGSTLEWEEQGNQVVVRRAGRFSSTEIHRALFGAQPPPAQTVEDLKDGVRRYVRSRYARH